MDLSSIYSTIFPIGGVDDNNNYVNLAGDKISSVQLIEPSLAISQLTLKKKDSPDKNNVMDKYAYRIPIIAVDDCRVEQTNVTDFKLDYSGFVPCVMVEFVDPTNEMLSTNIAKDGSIIKVYVGGQGDELYYKPIRQDFVVTSIKKTGGGDQNEGDPLRYRLYGRLNVPYGYRREAWCGGEVSAMQALFNLCIYTGLGFATNFTKTNTLDVMNWRNDEVNSYFDFMENICNHACYSPNTFFTGFIDQYNVFNFVECHSLLSHGGKKTDIPAMIYKAYPPLELPDFDPETEEKTTRNQLVIGDGEDELNNKQQKLSYYFLSNNEFFNGWSNFIEEYLEINNGAASLDEGYKCHVYYSDSNVGNWGMSVCEFNIMPIDNLKRDTSSQKIQSMPAEPAQNSYIPLNLMQMNKKDYKSKDLPAVNDMSNIESLISFGEVDTSNMFKQYFFAEVQNNFQMKCMKKCGLKVTLQNYNPSITRFSRIWVDIYDKNMISNSELAPTEVRDNDDGDYAEYKHFKNENILKFEDDGIIESIDGEKKNENWPRGEFNRSLSGWYVVTEIVIRYEPRDNSLKMILKLNRIEYQPCFKDEYYVAKGAIDKYKNINIVENLVGSRDSNPTPTDPDP